MKRSLVQSQRQELFYAIQLKQMTDDEVRAYHRKKYYELSKPEPDEWEFRVDGSAWKNGQILAEEPTYEQKEWVVKRLRAPNYTWRAFKL